MSKKRNVPAHGRKAARSRRPRKRRFLVVAGGAVTEKQYFKQLESLYDVIIDYQQKNNSPKQLAKLAVKLKREDKRDTSTDCYERIWVVVDVDDFHDHGEAARICNDNGIELIISNPCFEVWLLDYVKACPSSYTLTPDVESAAAEAKVVGGTRNKYINTELIDKEHLEAAIRNAARHNTYVCLLIDLANRSIAGHSADTGRTADLVMAAFATLDFPLTEVEVFHTDRGSEFDNAKIDELLDVFDIRRSLSRKGNPYDNAVVESTNRLLKKELIYRNHYTSLEQLRSDLNDYVWWFNNQRLHSTLGYRSPKEFTEQGLVL